MFVFGLDTLLNTGHFGLLLWCLDKSLGKWTFCKYKHLYIYYAHTSVSYLYTKGRFNTLFYFMGFSIWFIGLKSGPIFPRMFKPLTKI